MNNYTKPTLSFLTLTTTTGLASSCKTGTAEAKELIDFLKDMGLDEGSFSAIESCDIPVGEFDPAFSSYCKFSGAVQVFYS